MARIDIKMINHFVFETEIDVRITDINPANHVGHDTFVSLIHEARVQFFESLGYPASPIDKKGIIIADIAVSYKSQSFHGDKLRFELGAGEFNKYGCDIFCKITNSKTGALVVLAKIGIVFFDYSINKKINIPEAFVSHFV